MQEILFVCTGNYYRSRFAQAVFNHRAQELGLSCRAFSRGLNIGAVLEGDELSIYTREEMQRQGLPLELAGERRVSLTLEDLRRAERTVVLKRTEHYPMMRTQFPDFAEAVTYWEVHDLDAARPEEALPQIQALVETLVGELKAEKR
ncbi:MAG: low molecular weight phosphatase family protein [Opitutales bacterium]